MDVRLTNRRLIHSCHYKKGGNRKRGQRSGRSIQKDKITGNEEKQIRMQQTKVTDEAKGKEDQRARSKRMRQATTKLK